MEFMGEAAEAILEEQERSRKREREEHEEGGGGHEQEQQHAHEQQQQAAEWQQAAGQPESTSHGAQEQQPQHDESQPQSQQRQDELELFRMLGAPSQPEQHTQHVVVANEAAEDAVQPVEDNHSAVAAKEPSVVVNVLQEQASPTNPAGAAAVDENAAAPEPPEKRAHVDEEHRPEESAATATFIKPEHEHEQPQQQQYEQQPADSVFAVPTHTANEAEQQQQQQEQQQQHHELQEQEQHQHQQRHEGVNSSSLVPDHPVVEMSVDNIVDDLHREPLALDEFSTGIDLPLSIPPTVPSIAPAEIKPISLVEALSDPLLAFEPDDGNGRTLQERIESVNVVRNLLTARRQQITEAMQMEKRQVMEEYVALTAQKKKLMDEWDELQASMGVHMRKDKDGVCFLQVSQCQEIIAKLMATSEAALYFNTAVDPVAAGIPHYFDFVKTPMDFGTIRQNLEAGRYQMDTDLFIAHVRLVFRNCMLFNAPAYEVSQFAKKLSGLFEDAIRDPSKISAIKTKKVALGISASARPPAAPKEKSKKRQIVDEESSPGAPVNLSGEDVATFEFGALVLKHVEQFCTTLKRHPELIKRKKLAFFKEFLLNFDFVE